MRVCVHLSHQFYLFTTSSAKYGYDKSALADGVPANYFYAPSTAKAILRRHIYQSHPEEYDTALVQQVSLDAQS
jgi:hypothetical protein